MALETVLKKSRNQVLTRDSAPSVRNGEKIRLRIAVLGLLALLVCFCSFPMGGGRVGFWEAYRILWQTVCGAIPNGWKLASFASHEQIVSRILTQNYLPRLAGSLLVGGSLAASGAAYQGIFRNPLVSPDLLGASSGAAFGGALGLFFGWSAAKSVAAAFVCGLLAVLAVYLISFATRDDQPLTMLLAGVMISSIFHAGITAMKTFADDDTLPAITFWLLGSISPGFDLHALKKIILPVAAGLIVLYRLRWKVNLATLGDDEARSLGINPMLLRGITIFAATLITSACVAVCGSIGWVGLVVPHLMRRFVGRDYRALLPASILTGGIVVLLLDDLALIGPAVTPLGVFTGFIGVPFYIALLLNRRNEL
jgi:iron complex transport system permease protein